MQENEPIDKRPIKINIDIVKINHYQLNKLLKELEEVRIQYSIEKKEMII